MDVINSSELEQAGPPDTYQNPADVPGTPTQGTTPLPWFQLTIVYLIQFSEPVTALVIYPFVNQFIRETGVTGGDEKKTGYFGGTIESAFFLSEAATVVFWGMASDRFGRRPILILGPLGLTIATLAFGISTKFWHLVAFRCFQGVFNGNIGVSKAVIGELTDQSNIADAIAFIPFMWSVGATLGPIMGGLLSRPAVRWPDTLGRISYLKDHPYFLPCFAAALVSLFSFFMAFAGLRETLPFAGLRRKRNNLAPSPSLSTPLMTNTDAPSYGSAGHLNHPDNLTSPLQEHVQKRMDVPDSPSFQEVLIPDVLGVLANQCTLSFCDMCATALFPLMWSTSVKNGGLGFKPYTIGLIMGSFGMINSFIQVKFLSRVIKLFGPRKVYMVCFSSMIVTFACFPLEAYFARQPNGHWKMWFTILVQLAMESLKYGAYGAMQILITCSAPSKGSLGTVNGLAQAFGSVMRSLAPSISSSLYALSLQNDWAGGNAVYYILMVTVMFGVRISLFLPKTLRL